MSTQKGHFEGLTIKDFWNEVSRDTQGKPFHLIQVEESDTVQQVIHVLSQNKITSAPVFSKSQRKYVGMVDMLDLITFCTAKFSVPFLTEAIGKHQVDEFLCKKVAHVIELSGRNLWREIRLSGPLSELVQLLVQSNIHRIALDDDKDRVIGIATQSNLLSYLYKHKEKFFRQEVLEQPLQQWTFLPVEKIHQHKTTLEAFQLLWEKEVSGVGVVNAGGQLVGVISASELKRISFHPPQQMVRDLYSRLEEFLFLEPETQTTQKQEEGQIPQKEFTTNRSPIFLTLDDSFETALRTLSRPNPTTITSHIHRVFVVDEERKPVGVISMGNAIRKCLE